jgi:CheY-like chemotaxis protein
MVTEEWPDVVILDLLMPGVDGWELAHRLDPGPRGMRSPLIAITGLDGKDHRSRAREAGIDLDLLKPVQLDALASVLDRFWRVIAPVAVE